MELREVDLQHLLDRLRGILAPRAEILEAYLFGSTAQRRPQAHSDLDVAVFIDPDRSGAGAFGYRAELTTALMAGLGTNTIDIVILNQAPPLLYHRVLRDGVRVLSRDLRATTVREGTALSRYCDFVPQLDKLERATQGPTAPEHRRG